MANDLSLAARRAIIVALRSDATLTSLVPPDRIYPPGVPAKPQWPFIRYGSPTTLPDRASGLDGARIVVDIHSFARGPGEDSATQIGARVGTVLEAEGIVTEDGDALGIFWTGALLLRDTDEADAWHHVNSFEIEIGAGTA